MNKLAFLFPGQGSQVVGMGQDLQENFPLAREIIDKCNNILGYNLWEIIEKGPKDKLDLTENTQPAILTISYILSELLKEAGVKPLKAAGLSLGEYSALVCGGVISYEEALPLVKKRGEIMQKAVPLGTGGMVALLGATVDKVESLLKEIKSGYVKVANYNCPGQYVVTGETSAIDEVLAKAKEYGIKRAVKLDVSGPFHSKFLEKAGIKLQGELEKIPFNEPQIQIYSNVTAQRYSNGQEIKELLVKQVSHPVLWEQTIQNMINDGVFGFVEVGPQKTLSAMVKKISTKVWVKNVEDSKTLEEFLQFYERI
ncbi:ACP S-malonyltransferase [Anaerobranca californiensis]|uniref:ACP S-malonyltransferase n=1 Tax=Anaerobranca californiensis TaxID=182411 RepID=UPI000A033116|nr:ACP S-malonyltransferase [Anaerobranca californiensis]